MIAKFESYIEQLPLSQVVKLRIDEVLILNQNMINQEIIEIFMGEVKNIDGRKTFTSLWLFTDEYTIECKDFLSSIDFDIAPYKNRVQYCSIKSNDYDFNTYDTNSFVEIRLHFIDRITGTLIASGENCPQAYKIYKDLIIPNVTKV